MERATGIEPVFPAWEAACPRSIYNNLRLLSKMHLAFLAALVSLPDLASSGGTLVAQSPAMSI